MTRTKLCCPQKFMGPAPIFNSGIRLTIPHSCITAIITFFRLSCSFLRSLPKLAKLYLLVFFLNAKILKFSCSFSTKNLINLLLNFLKIKPKAMPLLIDKSCNFGFAFIEYGKKFGQFLSILKSLIQG